MSDTWDGVEGAHVYKDPSGVNKGLVLVYPAYRSHMVKGTIWCWSHGAWEGIPDSWFDLEATLRDAVTREWQDIRRSDRLLFQSPAMRERTAGYCGHRGWKAPDFTDRYSVFRFVDDLRGRIPIRDINRP